MNTDLLIILCPNSSKLTKAH